MRQGISYNINLSLIIIDWKIVSKEFLDLADLQKLTLFVSMD